MARVTRWAIVFVIGAVVGFSVGVVCAQNPAPGGGGRVFEGIDCCEKIGHLLYGIETAISEMGPYDKKESEVRTLSRAVLESALSNAGFKCQWSVVTDGKSGTVQRYLCDVR
jgi:hypothetical protein